MEETKEIRFNCIKGDFVIRLVTKGISRTFSLGIEDQEGEHRFIDLTGIEGITIAEAMKKLSIEVSNMGK